MRIPKKKFLTLIGGVFGLMAIALVFILILTESPASDIPLLTDSSGHSEAVQEQLTGALDLALRKPSADNLGNLGMVYHSSACYKEAGKCYALAAKRDNSAWLWNYYLGFLNMEMGNSEAVIGQFIQVTEKNPDLHLAWYYLGAAYRNLGRDELAETSYGKITGILESVYEGHNAARYDYFPLGTYASYRLARLYMETGRTHLAESTLLGVIQNNRSFGPAYRLLGNLYSLSGDSAMSERYGTRANDLLVFSRPVDTLVDKLVLMSRSELYLLKKIGDAERSIYPEWAMTLVNHALRFIPDNKYLVSKAIRINLMLNRGEEAAAFTDQHIGYFQDNFAEMNNMGILFFQNGFYLQSVKYLSRALDLKPLDANNQNSLAISYWKMGNKNKSYELLNEVLEENRDRPEVLIKTTNILFDLGEEAKARQMLSRIKQLRPEDPRVLMMSGMVARSEGDIPTAIRFYEASFALDPEDKSTLRTLGELYIQQQMWEPYLTQFRKALEYQANDPFLLERLGTMLVTCPDPDFRDTPEGREYSERAFIHKSSTSMTVVSAGRSLALAYATLGDKQNAGFVIQRTIQAARNIPVSPSYLQELDRLARQIRTLPG